MNILAVYAHPSPKSFNRAILNAVVEEAKHKGHEITVRDLYGERFQPVLTNDDFVAFSRGEIPDDVKAEQDALRRADVVIIIHPIWWFGLPAIIKGWIDRVFSYGFAYSHDSKGVKPLLAGKKAVIINTAGGAEAPGYDDTGYKDAMVRLTDMGIYKFVGFEVILRRMFFQVPTAGDEARRGMLDLVRSDLRKIL